jgi:hypothetical protein
MAHIHGTMLLRDRLRSVPARRRGLPHGSASAPRLPLDPAEAVPNGGGADLKLSANPARQFGAVRRSQDRDGAAVGELLDVRHGDAPSRRHPNVHAMPERLVRIDGPGRPFRTCRPTASRCRRRRATARLVAGGHPLESCSRTRSSPARTARCSGSRGAWRSASRPDSIGAHPCQPSYGFCVRVAGSDSLTLAVRARHIRADSVSGVRCHLTRCVAAVPEIP